MQSIRLTISPSFGKTTHPHFAARPAGSPAVGLPGRLRSGLSLITLDAFFAYSYALS